ncbi:TOMM system kinase/cyclase fusion protein [Polyangium sp. y55x31]|uniref:TOMM system kinase/cyclase fusion protein n=1 Tax=Polyangium sp. y55x31 TaxID=3042688 RepID=UPI002482E73C|nr:TOMM system kinase/cyclase fusion protein [Polyangium sp. y55x31]MDI1480333.1 TOMM system kinase/cyclase fusion protein [Polyangium sp. y55x31]
MFEGRYEILGDLGKGGFGAVYKARQRATGQVVALKVMRPPANDDAAPRQQRIARFLREAQLSAGLHHPNIVQLVDAGQTSDGGFYTVFSFAPGHDLADLIAREGALEPLEARHLMLEVLDALACAHAAGVVHRDLKPKNIMVIPTGARRNALVLDFGVGALVGEAEAEAGEILGTPGYAAPEQLRGLEPTPRADLFAWGLVFLECLTGEPVIRGSSTGEIIQQSLSAEPVPLPPLLEHHPLGAILRAATRKDVSARDVTAAGLFAALEACDMSDLARGVREPRERASTATRAARSIAAPGAGERRQVTAVCCTVDTHATAVDDEGLRAALAGSAEVARRHGGHVAAMFGDELLVYFGFPRAGEDDAARAARAALAMLGALKTRGDGTEARVGVHTGLVVADEHGFAAGITPRLASRLARSAPPGAALATAEAYKLLRGSFALAAEGARPLDTTGGAIEVYRLLGVAPATRQAPEGDPAPLVGRDREIDLLLDRWQRARAGGGQSSLVTGEPGIGKSRLLREFRARLGNETYTFVEGRCSLDTRSNALHPVVDLLARALGLDAEPLPAGKAQRLGAELTRHGLAPADVMPLFLPLFSLPIGAPWTPLDVSPQKQKELTHAAILALLFAMAEARPLLLVFEDLHWADPTTLELLGQLVREAPSAPICLLLTARADFSPAFSTTGVLQLQLNRLERPEIESMVGGLMGKKALPSAVLERIAERTDGIPLFVEELLRMMVESGALVEREDRYDLAGALSDLEIPITLRALLTARLDRLGRAKETAQLAAALGRAFRVDVLAAVSPLDAADLQEDLDRLSSAGLVFRKRRAKEPGGVFKHALVRDAAYESLASEARRNVHARIAATLEERFMAIVEARPDLLAHHYTEAAMAERAIPYWQQAGQRALGQSASLEATQHFQRALDLLATQPDLPARAAQELILQLSLSVGLIGVQGYSAPAVGDAYERARNLCDRLGDSKQLFLPIWGLGAFHVVRAQLDTAFQLSMRAQVIAERENDAALLVPAHLLHGGSHLWLGELQSAREHLERGLSFYDAAMHGPLAALYSYDPGTACLSYLAMALWFLGHPDQAIEKARAAVAQTRAAGHAHSFVHSLVRAIQVILLRGEGGVALEAITELLAVAEDKGFPVWHSAGIYLRGRALCLEGQTARGIEDIREGLRRTLETGAEIIYPEFMIGLAEALGELGEIEEALEVVTKALEAVAVTGGRLHEAELHRLRGELHRKHDPSDAGAERAEASLRKALEAARRDGARSWELRAATSLARLWHERCHESKRTASRGLLHDTYAWFTEGFGAPHLKSAKAMLDELSRELPVRVNAIRS